MKHPDSHNGDYALGALILGITAWDILADETISNAVRRHTEQPWQKFLLCAGMGALALHFLSEEHDPFRFERRGHEQA